MIKIYSLLLACALFVLPYVAYADVQITEIAWMGIAGQNGQYGEWIELYNSGTSEVNLAGWKLYKGGSTLLFSLTKTIGAGGYLIIERTTASLPDPLPSISDESGSFGGGGLSNSGELLTLKDAFGTTVQTLSFANGWPAGDANTKETMQWNGTMWVTASATPKAPSVLPTDTPPTVQSTPSAPSSTQPASQVQVTPPGPAVAPTLPKVVPHITFSVAPNIHAGVPSTYGATVTLEYMTAQKGRFVWNMGDGTVIEQQESAPLTYTYEYPGTYTMVLSYYRTPYQIEPTLELAKPLTVFDPSIELSLLSGGNALKLANTTAHPIDLGGWNIVAGERTFVMPRMSILAANAAITMPTAFAGGHSTTAFLKTPTGAIIASVGGESITPVTSTAPPLKGLKHHKRRTVWKDASHTSAPSVEATTEKTPPAKQKHNRTGVYVVGAVVVASVGLLYALERFTVR